MEPVQLPPGTGMTLSESIRLPLLNLAGIGKLFVSTAVPAGHLSMFKRVVLACVGPSKGIWLRMCECSSHSVSVGEPFEL